MEKKEEKEVRKFLLYKSILILVIVILVIFLISIFLFIRRPLEVRTLDVSFTVAENPGFDLSTSSLTFGKIQPAGYSSRRVTLSNYNEFPVRVDVYLSKSIADVIRTEPSIVVEPNNSTTVAIGLQIPNDMEKGNYSGRIAFRFYRLRE